MAKLSLIMDVERRRLTQKQETVIHLWADGTFYRAYEWSAWLCVRYVRSFKATKRIVKSIGADMVFVGFPQSSLEKYLPEGAVIGTNADDEKGVIITLSPEMVRPDEGSTLEQDFQNWRTAVPLTVTKDSSAVNPQDSLSIPQRASSPMSLTGIFKEIVSYPIVQSSPIESMLFLADIQKRLSSLL